MKVLFICPFVPWPLVNGGKIRTYNLIQQASTHAEIHLRVVADPDHSPEAEEALRSVCKSLRFFERERPSPITRWMRPKLERWFHSPRLIADVRTELARGSIHLVHLDELLLARIVAPDPKTPVIQHHHKLDTVLYDTLTAGQGLKRHFDRWKLRRLEAESARRYRHHLLCSAGDADILRERYGALDCGVVPSGFDPTHYRASDPPMQREPERLVFLGSMNYGPNVDAVLHFVETTLPLIRRTHPGVHLEIVGGEPVDEVKALANDQVTVTGRVPDVRMYLERGSMLVVPLRIGGGTRLKIVEALALGTPTVSTTIGAEGLGLAAPEHLRLADDPSAFAAAVSELIEDPTTAAAMGARGMAFVHKRYRWETLAEELVDAWERVMLSGKLGASR